MVMSSSSININWACIDVKSWPITEKEADDIIMTIPRDNTGRNTDRSYEIERGFLDLVNQEQFIHRVYETNIPMMDGPIFIEFNPDEIRIGLSSKYTNKWKH